MVRRETSEPGTSSQGSRDSAGAYREESKLWRPLREISADHIRRGCRMACRMLRGEVWTVNHKRVLRIWRKEGLQRPTPRKLK
jgi:hypothetical protein